MDTNDKRLLMEDLCQRIPYGTKVCCQKYFGFRDEGLTLETYDATLDGYLVDHLGDYASVKPYLRPMHTMTDAECEMSALLFGIGLGYDRGRSLQTLPITMAERYVRWLNENCFDYRNLIGKGLALEAPEGMYWQATVCVNRNQRDAAFGSDGERSRSRQLGAGDCDASGAQGYNRQGN